MVLSFTGESNDIARQRESVRSIIKKAAPEVPVLFDVEFLNGIGSSVGKGRIEGVVSTLIWLDDDSVLFVFLTGERMKVHSSYIDSAFS